MSELERQGTGARVARRFPHPLAVGAVVGAAVGLVMGVLAGLYWSSWATAAFWMAVIGLGVYGSAFGALVSGSLEWPYRDDER
jgi:hypothetical protein